MTAALFDVLSQQLIGNEQVKVFFKHMLRQGAISHLFLFSGPKGVGKSLFAEALGKALIGEQGATHPDLRWYRPEGKLGLHSMEAMKDLSRELAQPPYCASRRVFLLCEAERMLPTSANALLKSFEEPNPSNVIFLISSHAEALLPTIRSRCRCVYFQCVEEEAIASYLQLRFHKAAEEARLLAGLARGSMGKAVRWAHDGVAPWRRLLLEALAFGKMASYEDLRKVAEEISRQVELVKESVLNRFVEQNPVERTAWQREQRDREIEGMVSMRYVEEVDSLVGELLGWYRDLQLLSVNGSRRALVHKDQESALEQAFQRGVLIPLEEVEAACQALRLAVARSTSLRSCLEALFLKLHFL